MLTDLELSHVEPAELAAGLSVARAQKVAVFIVAYNAEAHIEETIRRIPQPLVEHLAAIFLIDDSSTDSTVGKTKDLKSQLPILKVFSTPYNQGYGGNQKIGYSYAISQGFDIVALLHGDGQYAPEVLPRLLAPFAEPQVAAVFGSRMMLRGTARKGGMPLYKRIGNRILTVLENLLMRSDLSEWHSGYRAYRTSFLARVPFRYNTGGFHFDTQVIVQFLASGFKIREVPIPTYYGDEICRVEGIPYAIRCVATVVHYLTTRLELFYHPRYDLEYPHNRYSFKRAPDTVHQWVLSREFRQGETVVDLGCANGELAEALHQRGADVVGVDERAPDRDFLCGFMEYNLDSRFADAVLARFARQVDTVVALDVLEHLVDVNAGVREVHAMLKSGGRLVASTANIAFLPLRLMLLFGQFNYGRRGILDMTHKRLLTLGSFRRLLVAEGFRIDQIRGFGPPIRDMLGDTRLLRTLDRLLARFARVWPRLFAYQILVEATRIDSLEDVVGLTVGTPRRTTTDPSNRL